jgi:hypothetical protein
LDYDFWIPASRPLIAPLVLAGALALAGGGCANRGMVAPSELGGSGGATTGTGGAAGNAGGATGAAGKGTGGTAGAGGTAGIAGAAGAGGTAGAGGKGGGSGGSNVDASCSLVTDALFDHSTTTCNAMFNFETGIQGATLLPGSQAFTSVTQATVPHTYCGTGALGISASFVGTTGPTTKGEVDLPLGVDGGTANLSGKTLTVRVSASPAACGEDLRFKVIVDTTKGSPTGVTLNAITANYTTVSATVVMDAGTATTNALAIQAYSTTGYTGTIYVDEIDIK